MKRLITLALAFAVTVTGISALLPVEARSLSGAYADQAALLAEIGLMDTVSESEAAQMAVTRGEFAQYLGSILQIEEVGVTDTRYFVDVPLDHWAVSAINRLTEMGVISIGADRKFRPGDKITENEALKMALSAAGYGEYAQVKGGYPAGFYQTAKELNMPVSGSDEPLMLSAAVELLYEILQVPVYIGQSYTGDVVGYGPSKETLLSLYYDMYAAEGVVTYAGGIALDGGSVEEENIIRVDGTREYRTELNLLNDAGRYISFVCKDSKSGLDEIVLVNTEKNQDKMIEFYKEDLIEYRSADNTLVYYSDAEREVQARLAKNAVVVKNGKLMDENTAGAFEFNKGSIRLINVDTDGSYDYVIIYAYENYVIESVDAASEVLYDALDPARKISINPDMDQRKIRIQDTAGNEIAYADIPADSILSVCESEDFVLATVSTNQVTGTVYQVSDGENSIPKLLIGKNQSDTQWYQMDKDYYQEEYGDSAGVNVGASGTYYLDFRGNLALLDIDAASEWQYAYLVAHATDTLFAESSLKLKLFLQTGEMRECDVAPKVEIDGRQIEDGAAALTAIAKQNYNKVLAKEEDPVDGQLIRVKFNSEGEVNGIDTEYVAPEKEGTQNLKRTANVQTLYYRWHAGSFNGQFVRGGNTVFFGVPTHENLKTADDREFQILPSSWFGDQNYTVEGFKLDQEDGYEDAIVCYGIASEQLAEGYYLVEYAGETVNADGAKVRTLHVWSAGGVESDLQAEEDYDFSVTLDENGVANTYTADAGDIIRIGRNFSGDINQIELVYDLSRKDDPNYSITWNTHNDNIYREYGNLMHGYIKSYRDGVLRITWNKPTDGDYADNPQKADYVAPKQAGAVLIFDSTRRDNPVYLGSNADLISADKAGEEAQPYFLYMTSGVFRGAIVYR